MYPILNGRLSRKWEIWAAGLAVFLGVIGGGNLSAANELGHPLYRDFAPGQNRIAHLCQAVTQDSAGYLYIANQTLLQFYDGGKWVWIPLPDEAAGIRKFAVTANGTIYAGGAGVMGWIRSSGQDREFVSLASELPFSSPDFEDIYDVFANGKVVYFSTENHLLIWREERLKVVPFPTPSHSRGARFHLVGEEVYVSAPGCSLSRLVGDQIETVIDDPFVRQNDLIEIRQGGAGELVFLTAERGFFQLKSGQITPREIEANRWLKGRRIICALRLIDDSLVVAFSAPTGDGGMRFDATGHYLGPIDNSLGLYVKTVRAFFADREGGLWLGTETGMFRLEWPSPATLFDNNNGLGQGEVLATVRHEGVVYAATTEGLYRLHPVDESGQVARFVRLFNSPSFAVLSHDGGLLNLGYEAISVLESEAFRTIAKLPPGGGNLVRSEFDPARVWITTTRGILSVRHTPKGWVDEGMLPAFSESVTALVEDSEGALQITTTELKRFSVKFTADGIRPEVFVAKGGTPPEIPVLAEWATADRGRWVARAEGIDYESADGNEVKRLPYLIGAATGVVTSLREENDPAGAVLWVSGKKGLVRLEVQRNFPPPPPLLLQLYSTDLSGGETFAPNPPPLRFGFLAQRHQYANVVEYQTRLVGLERGWTPWSLERNRTYPNLGSGRYHFEVRARDAAGVVTPAQTLSFTVRPAWWATSWAILGYVIFGFGAVGGVVRIRMGALRRRNEQLEAIVSERTVQLQQHSDELDRQNDELVRLNRLEWNEKIAAKLAEEKSRLEVLRYQLNPHFLFNTLASISASLPAGRSTARSMLERLSEFCRLTLHPSDEGGLTTLGDEIELMSTYLEIEQSRWGDLLDVEISVDPSLSGMLLPYFLLLPLLENALKYGRQTSLNRVGVRVTARRDSDGAAILEVANTGEWTEPQGAKSTPSLGIGLENLRERLTRYYPQAHHLEVVSAKGWVVVTLKIMGSAHPH